LRDDHSGRGSIHDRRTELAPAWTREGLPLSRHMTNSTSQLPFDTDAGRHMPVTGIHLEYQADEETPLHELEVCQLIHSALGVVVVSMSSAKWIVPPNRAVWMPAKVAYSIRAVSAVALRILYIHSHISLEMPSRCMVVAIGPLLRELILAATRVTLPYQTASRDGHLVQLLLDEIVELKPVPLSLPLPNDPRLKVIESVISRFPADQSTERQWARQLRVDPKTIHRLFVRDTGMSFGRWRQQARLMRALELLATGKPILDVAVAVGYRSPTAFSTMFQRHLGCAPSAYFSPQNLGT
jgi:AraC-like DNA-binding protein